MRITDEGDGFFEIVEERRVVKMMGSNNMKLLRERHVSCADHPSFLTQNSLDDIFGAIHCAY